MGPGLCGIAPAASLPARDGGARWVTIVVWLRCAEYRNRSETSAQALWRTEAREGAGPPPTISGVERLCGAGAGGDHGSSLVSPQ